jgi:hypothetical protein
VEAELRLGVAVAHVVDQVGARFEGQRREVVLGEPVEQPGEALDLLGDERLGHRLLDPCGDPQLARGTRHELALDRVMAVGLDRRHVGVAQRLERAALGLGEHA